MGCLRVLADMHESEGAHVLRGQFTDACHNVMKTRDKGS